MKSKNIKNKKRPRIKKISQSYENREKSAKLAQKRPFDGEFFEKGVFQPILSSEKGRKITSGIIRGQKADLRRIFRLFSCFLPIMPPHQGVHPLL